jgi:hypothetical protein
VNPVVLDLLEEGPEPEALVLGLWLPGGWVVCHEDDCGWSKAANDRTHGERRLIDHRRDAHILPSPSFNQEV